MTGQEPVGGAEHAAPRAAVIIPHLNDHRRLARCLQALVTQPGAGEVEILVVDNGSAPDLAPLIARFPTVRFLTDPTPDAAAARNRGVAASRAPWLFFTDADCLPAPDWLRVALTQGPLIDGCDGIIGGRVRLFDETAPPRSGAQAFETVFAFAQGRYVRRQGFSVTANLLTRRAVFLATGPFRPGTPEDRDWCQRARARGVPIALRPDLVVGHPTRRDWPALRRKWQRLTAEAHALRPPGPTARLTWAMRGLAVAASGAGHLPRVVIHPALAPGEKLRGALTLLRLRLLRAAWMLRQAAGGRSPGT